MDKAKRKRIKRYITWACMAAVVIALAVMPLLAKQEAEADGPQASILSGTVKKGTVETALRGGGNLESGAAEDVKLPSGVKITEFLVKNGDTVAEGDPVAKVDKVSVMTAITEVTDTMEYLQDEMESSRNDTVSSYVRANAGGRVKVVYAQVGDDVQDVMLEHGALAVLSLDGLMAVDIERKMDIATGDVVSVSLPDGTEVEGRVESNLNGKIVITLEDEGYPIGEAVVVRTEDGDRVGSGTLYVHNAWKAVAFTGTVSGVSAKVESSVYEGSTLFTLKDTSFTAQLEYNASLHREYEKLLQRLFVMYETGVITAPCEGVVSGVDEDSAFLLAGEKVDWEMVPLAVSEETGWKVILLSNMEETVPETTVPEETLPEGILPEVSYVGYAGRVTTVGINGLILSMNQTAYPVSVTEEGGWNLSQVNTDTELMLASNVLYPAEDVSGYTVGDIVVILYDNAGNFMGMVTAVKAEPEQILPGGGQIPGGMGGFGGMSGGMGGMGGFGGMSGAMGAMGAMGGYGGGAVQEDENQLFDLEGEVLLTVTNQEAMKLTITLDEQDIVKVEAGQAALVKVTALKGQVFEAEVTKVGLSGTNNGGSSKFTVELTLDKAEDMLAGMSATATIPMTTRMDVLTIPVAALVEDREKTVVYTALDPETGKPANPVEVETGLSDGENVEIRQGLSSGDSYYYSYYDTLELDNSAVESKFGF